METIWGIAVVVLSLLAWGGQTMSWFAPSIAARLTLAETEEAVEQVYWADIRGEALWDVFTLWVMGVAGVLLLLGVQAWAYFGLVGGSIYVYFAGRGILTRIEMLRRGFRIGNPSNVKVGLAMLTIWGVMGLVTLVAASIVL